MVYAFIIHTLFPGSCKILFYHVFGGDVIDSRECLDPSAADIRTERKRQMEYVAAQIHSEYQFRRATANRTVEDDIQALNREDTLPEMELGYLRFAQGEPFPKERIGVWLGTGNTGFTLVCYKEENRLLAESVLRLLVRCLQEQLRVLNQPAEVSLKADRVSLIISKLLPDGALIFMNHRVVRSLEMELDILMKA